MNEKKLNIINELFQKPIESFTEHLSLPNNERIIFSGRFGIGKTTFINHYFEQKDDHYNVVHLYPVNYSVLKNEDIFTYLKYDILIDLIINKHVVLKSSTKYGVTESLPFFLRYKWYSILTLLPLVSEKLGGRNVHELMKGLGTLKDEFDSFRKGPKEQEELADPFFKFMHKSEGSLYESNDLTEIIKDSLQEIKGTKQNILIIDDLDRIDPAHIFRILNVFSAHFDDRNVTPDNETSNKFGFDKVIMVCDIDNIRNIYAAIYGGSTDFNGYIDKFFSKEIYRYDNKENILNIIENVVKSILVDNYQVKLYSRSHNSAIILVSILHSLVEQNKINIRSLLKYWELDLDIRKKQIYIQNVEVLNNQVLIVIKVLLSLFGDLQTLKREISGLNSYVIDDKYYMEYHICDLLVLLNYKKLKRAPSGSKHIIDYNGKDYSIRIEKNERGKITSLMETNQNDNLNEIDFTELFKKVVSIID